MSYSGLRSPGRSYSTYLWNSNCWVQTFHNISVLLQIGQLQKLQDAGPNCKDFTEVARSSWRMLKKRQRQIFNYIKCLIIRRMTRWLVSRGYWFSKTEKVQYFSDSLVGTAESPSHLLVYVAILSHWRATLLLESTIYNSKRVSLYSVVICK